MQNIFGSNSQYRLTYWIIWVIGATGYAAILILLGQIAWMQAWMDALLFSSLFAVMGMAVWYVVKFSGLDSASVLNTMVTHLVAGGVLVFVIVISGETFLDAFFANDNEFYSLKSPYHLYRLLVGSLIYIFLAINFYLIVYYEEYRSRKIRQVELDQHLKYAELNLLKAQINPHFIFNSLNSISSLTLTNAEKAHEMVILLADFLRYSIHKNADQLVKLEQEIEAIELFLAIEKIRYGERLKVEVSCDEKSKIKLLPALILQPLVENAIKYSLYETDLNSNILINCQSTANELQVEIANNYSKDAVVTKGEGIGLRNVRSRLGLVYNRHDLLETDEAGNLYKVIITFPQL
jgi:sensor histidine kinase YesM